MGIGGESMIMNSGVRKVTVVARGDMNACWFLRCSCHSSGGVTIGKLFALIVMIASEAFDSMDAYGDGGRVRGVNGRRVPVSSYTRGRRCV